MRVYRQPDIRYRGHERNGGKWKLRIIIAISAGHGRFNDLQRALQGISARVLSTELKELEQTGFVQRRVQPTTPVVVEYPTATRWRV